MDISLDAPRALPISDPVEPRLRHRVAVVTGGTAGVGRATALALAHKGFAVAVLGRDPAGVANTLRELRQASAKPMFGQSVDVCEAAAVEQVATDIEATLGSIDLWVNNAMVTVFAPVSRMTAEEYAQVTQTTYLGTVHGTLAALRRMRARNRGTILQVGSALSYRSIPLQSAYCGAKFAIRGFTDSLRTELIHDRSRIRLTMVQLPAVNTTQFNWARNKMPRRPQPVPPIFDPRLIGRAIAEVALHPRREVFLGWSSIKAILANKLMPGFCDWAAARSAYESQESDESSLAGAPDNLRRPVVGHHRAEGRFSQGQVQHDAVIWAQTHRATLTGLLMLALVAWKGPTLLQRLTNAGDRGRG